MAHSIVAVISHASIMLYPHKIEAHIVEYSAYMLYNSMQ